MLKSFIKRKNTSTKNNRGNSRGGVKSLPREAYTPKRRDKKYNTAIKAVDESVCDRIRRTRNTNRKKALEKKQTPLRNAICPAK